MGWECYICHNYKPYGALLLHGCHILHVFCQPLKYARVHTHDLYRCKKQHARIHLCCPHPSMLWWTVSQFWYCIWNWNTAFEFGHWIYTHDQHRWSWLTKTVRYSREGIYTHVIFLETRTNIQTYHYTTQ